MPSHADGRVASDRNEKLWKNHRWFHPMLYLSDLGKVLATAPLIIARCLTMRSDAADVAIRDACCRCHNAERLLRMLQCGMRAYACERVVRLMERVANGAWRWLGLAMPARRRAIAFAAASS